MAAEIPLTKGYVTVVDDCDADLDFPKWQVEEVNSEIVYAARKKYFGQRQKTTVKLHRLILERMLNRPLRRGEYVDHINGDGLDNRRCNLRLATAAQNQMNQRRRRDNTSGFKGVRFDRARQRWRAEIRVDGKHIFLGRFDTPVEAHRAYCKAAALYFGEFANDGRRS